MKEANRKSNILFSLCALEITVFHGSRKVLRNLAIFKFMGTHFWCNIKTSRIAKFQITIPKATDTQCSVHI